MRKAPFTVCVVGGGFTGAAVAIALMARIRSPFRLVIVERGRTLGRGIAYGSYHPLHLLNVRTRDLSVCASQPGDFLNWAFGQLDQGRSPDVLPGTAAGASQRIGHGRHRRDAVMTLVRESTASIHSMGASTCIC